MATSSTMRRLLALIHEYAAEPVPDDSDAASERDLAYFDRILILLGHDPDADRRQSVSGEYRVRWEIDLHALGHLNAARKARDIQLRPESIATVFEVVRRSDIAAEPDWSQAETIDLMAHRTDQEALDEIAQVLRSGEPPTAEDLAYITQLVQLTGREPLAASTTSPAAIDIR
jgi:hypothetical protein